MDSMMGLVIAKQTVARLLPTYVGLPPNEGMKRTRVQYSRLTPKNSKAKKYYFSNNPKVSSRCPRSTKGERGGGGGGLEEKAGSKVCYANKEDKGKISKKYHLD